jgi:hypothetical protein
LRDVWQVHAFYAGRGLAEEFHIPGQLASQGIALPTTVHCVVVFGNKGPMRMVDLEGWHIG